MGTRRRAILLSGLTTVALVAALEGVGYLLTPVANDPTEERTATFNDVYYVYDRDLLVRLQPSRRHDFKSVRPDLDATISTNSSGFRGEEHAAPDPEAFRVLVLGDSVSFGFGVNDDETWPALVANALHKAAPGRRIQLRNLSVPGYTTFHGRLMFERHALSGDFKPHLVVFAFGFNDSYLRPHDDFVTRDGERFRHETWAGLIRTWLQKNSYFFTWVWQEKNLARKTPRVSPKLVRENLEAVATAALGAGIELVLIDSCLTNTYVRDPLRAAAAAHGLTWLSFREVFRSHKRLAPEGPWPEGGTLRITVDTYGLAIPASPDDRPHFYALVLTKPNERPLGKRVPLNDDGRHGDRRSGDGRWSCLIDLPAGSRPELGFLIPALGDVSPSLSDEGRLLNGVHLQQPGPTSAGSDGSTAALALPFPNACPWPELVLSPDVIHASPEGCRLMAEAVTKVILETTPWTEFVK